MLYVLPILPHPPRTLLREEARRCAKKRMNVNGGKHERPPRSRW